MSYQCPTSFVIPFLPNLQRLIEWRDSHSHQSYPPSLKHFLVFLPPVSIPPHPSGGSAFTWVSCLLTPFPTRHPYKFANRGPLSPLPSATVKKRRRPRMLWVPFEEPGFAS